MFDDEDNDGLTITASIADLPGNVHVVEGPSVLPTTALATTGTRAGRVFLKAHAARTTTDVRVDLTATDPDGATATTHLIFQVTTFDDTKTPRFVTQVGTHVGTHRELEFGLSPVSRVLPAATGGDLGGLGKVVFDYTYSLSGTLPDGLSFDADTRTISGTPTRTTSFSDPTITYTYTAHDADNDTSAADAASQTFRILVVSQTPTITTTAPSFSAGDTASFSIAENHENRAAVGAVPASDREGDGLTYSLASGGDNDSFTIDAAGAIEVKSGVTLDYEEQASYTVTAQVTDGEDASGDAETTPTIDDTITVTITVTNVEEPPGEPTGVTVSGTPTTLTVLWSAPPDSGAPITGYDVRYAAGATDPENDADWIEHDHLGTETSTTIAELDPRTAYRVQVRAVGEGTGPWSASAGGRTTTPARRPTAPRFVGGNGGASFSIGDNHEDGAAVGKVPAADDDADELTYSLASGGDNESFTIDGTGTITVASGVKLNAAAQASYTLTVQVSDGEDAGGNAEATATVDDTVEVTITVMAAEPAPAEEDPLGAPTGVTVSAASWNSLAVSWSAPAGGGAQAITGYDVRYAAGARDPADDAAWSEHDHVGTATSTTIAGLAADTAYRVQVRAVGAVAGPWSGSEAGRTAAAPERAEPVAAPVRRVLQHTLAGAAARALTSALDHVGGRFAGAEPAAREAAVGYGVLPAVAGELRAQPGAAGRVVELAEVLRGSAFEVPLAAGADVDGDGEARWVLWGRGDLGDFSGRLAPDASYEGSTFGAWLGADASDGAWLRGMALSHTHSTTEYALADGAAGAERGKLHTTLTAVYPYASVELLDRIALQALAGAGVGEARHAPGGGAAAETSELWLLLGAVGVRGHLVAEPWLDVSARADGGWARLWTAAGPAAVNGLAVDGWRGRVGLEAAPRLALAADRRAELVPFVAVAGRQDGGDGLSGTGLEVAAGLRLSAPRLQVEARGRMLAVHTDEDARERGVSVTAGLSPRPDGSGLSLSLETRLGAEAAATDALWSEVLPRPAAAAAAGGTALEARIGYGAALPGGHAVLTPFAEAGVGDGESRVRVGARLDASQAKLGAELAGERRKRDADDPEHTVTFDLGLHY